MKLPKFLKSLFAALAFGLPNFNRGKDEAAEKEATPTEAAKPSKLQPGGVVEEVNKYYGMTIAGGPGSQRIGDTFDALPKAEREAMIAARKGRIIRVGSVDDIGDQGERPAVVRRHGTDAIRHALETKYTRGPGGKLVPKEGYKP